MLRSCLFSILCPVFDDNLNGSDVDLHPNGGHLVTQPACTLDSDRLGLRQSCIVHDCHRLTNATLMYMCVVFLLSIADLTALFRVT